MFLSAGHLEFPPFEPFGSPSVTVFSLFDVPMAVDGSFSLEYEMARFLNRCPRLKPVPCFDNLLKKVLCFLISEKTIVFTL